MTRGRAAPTALLLAAAALLGVAAARAAPPLACSVVVDEFSLLQHSSDAQARTRGDDSVRITVRDDRGKELHLEARKTTRLSKLIDVVCKRLELEKEYTKFQHAGKALSQYDTVDEFGLQDKDVIEVTGGRVRDAPARQEASAAAEATATAGRAAANAAASAAAERLLAAALTTAAPTAAPVFQVGDFMYVNISSGTEDFVNPWAPCSILGKGSEDDTYNIHFIFAPQGQRDIRDVPVRLLRKVDGRRYAEAVQYYREDTEAVEQAVAFVRTQQAAKEAAKGNATGEAASESSSNDTETHGEREASRQDTTSWQVGDFMEARLERNLSDIEWVPCRLIGKGERNGTYKVHFLFGSPGHADLTNVSTDFLRKISTREFAERSKEIKRVPQLAQEAALQLEQEAANRTRAEEEALKVVETLHRMWDFMLKEKKEAEKRRREAAKRAAEEVAKRAVEERKAQRERERAQRIADKLAAEQAATFEFKAGATVELKIEKRVKGTDYIPGSIAHKGIEPNSFDVHFDFGPPGHQDIANVPAAFLRLLDVEKFADALARFKGDAEGSLHAMEQAEREAGRRQRALAADRRAQGLGKDPQASAPSGPAVAAADASGGAVAVGDVAELKMDKSVGGSTWIPCKIQAPGKRNTFNVLFDFAVPKHKQELQNVPAQSLRKADPAEAAKILAQLQGDAELAEAALAEIEREASRRQRAEEAARRKRQEAKAKA